jgi:hypothetical protein
MFILCGQARRVDQGLWTADVPVDAPLNSSSGQFDSEKAAALHLASAPAPSTSRRCPIYPEFLVKPVCAGQGLSSARPMLPAWPLTCIDSFRQCVPEASRWPRRDQRKQPRPVPERVFPQVNRGLGNHRPGGRDPLKIGDATHIREPASPDSARCGSSAAVLHGWRWAGIETPSGVIIPPDLTCRGHRK